ncbi:response regulator [Nisaea nitritireducens]|uniref:response regulator n=1 Tax=Nisaea nitritireducens TaxID=568392 RepID=UPI001867B6D6|nr:response regulator transcription factor [Nisaea nitritireducens]
MNTVDQAHILVVDDDSRLRDLLTRFLSENGFRITAAGDAADARRKLAAIDYDLIVLDVMMPGETGFELTRSMRQTRDLPILLLTAMGEVEDRIEGLETGADDYLTKPFEPRELLLRIRTILRRTRSATPDMSEATSSVSFGPYIYDRTGGELTREGSAVHLTESEALLLGCFAQTPGRTLSRQDLVARNAVNGHERTVDVQINRLRRKIEKDPKFPRFLQTVRGKGYVLKANTNDA